jgi:hypothetical protein
MVRLGSAWPGGAWLGVARHGLFNPGKEIPMASLQIHAWIQGITALLQNRATEEALAGTTRSNTPGSEQDIRLVADRCVYRLPGSSQIGFPGSAIARMLREAGGSHKAKGSRKSLKYIVPAAVLVLDDLCGLYLNDRETPIDDYEIDRRPVTIPATKGRVMRYRPRFDQWTAPIRLRINDGILDEDLVRRLMIEGLQQIGIGDFRPERGGPFGCSDLVHWEVVAGRKSPTVVEEEESPKRRRKAA